MVAEQKNNNMENTMSTPWASEPTRICETDWNKKMKSVPLNDARDLERRMHAAENLLEWLLRECESNTSSYLNNGIDAAKKHLEAARKENGQ